MSVKAHIQSLNLRHQQLEEELHEAYVHHLPCTEIKKEKLRIKDEIEHLHKSEQMEVYKQAA